MGLDGFGGLIARRTLAVVNREAAFVHAVANQLHNSLGGGKLEQAGIDEVAPLPPPLAADPAADAEPAPAPAAAEPPLEP